MDGRAIYKRDRSFPIRTNQQGIGIASYIQKSVENEGEKAIMKGGEGKSRCMGYKLDFPAFRAKLKVYL
jgi:hypothetical protein